MTEWIVGNAWWFAPALTFAGVGMIVGAVLWPRKATKQHQRVSDFITNAPSRLRVD